MKTAIITGASSGLGREYAKKLHAYFPEITSVWLIARREERLRVIGEECGIDFVPLSLDLTSEADIQKLSDKLADEQPDVGLLINCAGCGYLSNVAETDEKLLARMVDLNIKALTLVTRVVTPYIGTGGHIINISSIASFCPNARMTVYSSSKSYVSSFSLGLREELRDKKISVTAVCPGPMETEFLDIGGITGNSKMFKTLPYCNPEQVVIGSMKASKADRAFYTPKAFFKFYRFVAKILPETLVVKLAKT